MVDYNIAIPQQQLFQAPDVMQNAMRMQHMQAQGAQMQELARQRSEEEASRNITAPLNSPEYFRQLARINPKFAVQAINLNRQNLAADRAADASTRQAEEAVLRMANIRQTMGDTAYKSAQDTLAIVPPGDAEGYAKWYGQFKSAFRGMNLPTPEQWAQDTNGQLKGHMLSTAESARTLMTPTQTTAGGVDIMLDRRTGVGKEIGIQRRNPTQPADTGAGGITTYPYPNALDTQRREARLGLGVQPIDQNAAQAAAGGPTINNMRGAAVSPTPTVGNALAQRPPQLPPASVQSPFGDIIGSSEVARQQTAETNRSNLEYEAQKAGMVKQAQTRAEKIEGAPKVQSSFVSAMAELQRQREAIADLKSRPWGTQFTTGPIMGFLPNMAPFDVTGAGAAQARIDQVKSSAGLTALQELKQSSPTGASGLGGASDTEGRRLEASKAALNQRQGTADFNQAVDTLDKDIEGAQKRLMEAYVRDYGELPPDIMAQLPPPLVAKAPAKGKLENRAGALNVPSNVSVSGW